MYELHILITRKQNSMLGGGTDRITLKDLLTVAGYRGEFRVELSKALKDGYATIKTLPDIKI